MNKKFILSSYLDRLNEIRDPLAQVITIHLFSEYWLDRILISICTNPNSLPNQINYKQKLDIVHSLVQLPDGLHKNLSKLNRLRNQCAHNLELNFSNADYNYDLSIMLEIDPNFSTDIIKCELNDRLNWIGVSTFSWLNTFAIKDLNLNPEIKEI
ncbi:hypothetical protein [Peribacillus sp. FSL E2-0159]|uniref:hypothetical protein n=1 Tax=Peribacillus sp. FSL E2-0159 TaxID=2975289 RepID=UPI00315A6205